MHASLPLHRLQRWFQAVVVHPGTIDEAVSNPDATSQIASTSLGDVILPSPTLTSAERVDIYHEMYPMRMEEALASDYPALKHFLGDQEFAKLVVEYVQVHPSRSYTLNRLGDHLPAFIKEHASIPKRGFCHDLARLELAVSAVFDAEETKALSAEAIAAVPQEDWARARFETIAAFRLLSFRYPVNEYLQTVNEDNHDHPKARLKSAYVAIYRRDYRPCRLDLTKSAHALLGDLVAGEALGASIERALKRPGPGKPTSEELFRWFRDWVAGGMFRSVSFN